MPLPGMDGWRVLSLLLPVLALAEDLDLVLYGAYGCVGRLTALHLANQTKLRWAIAGRNESKLAALAVELAATGGASSQPEIIVSALGPSVDLSWVGRAKAVATAAGPFSIHEGESLLAACAANGVHYVMEQESNPAPAPEWTRPTTDTANLTTRCPCRLTLPTSSIGSVR